MVLPCIVLGFIQDMQHHKAPSDILMPLLKVAWYMACYGQHLVCIVTVMTVMTVMIICIVTVMIVMTVCIVTVMTVIPEAKSCQMPEVSLCVACLSKLTLYCHQ